MNKIAIFIVVYNTDKFLAKQLSLVKDYCTDTDYVIYVVNNSAIDSPENEKIEYETNKAGAVYLKTMPEEKYSNPSRSHAVACNLIYQQIGRKADYCLFLDHDIFPITYYSITKKVSDGKIMAGLEQMRLNNDKKVQYLWAGLLFINNTLLNSADKSAIDFMPTDKYGVMLDTGGGLHEMICRYGESKFLFLNETREQNTSFDKNKYSYYQMLDNNRWMHFINGSNWAGVENEEERLALLFNIRDEKIRNSNKMIAGKQTNWSFNIMNKKVDIKITTT